MKFPTFQDVPYNQLMLLLFFLKSHTATLHSGNQTSKGEHRFIDVSAILDCKDTNNILNRNTSTQKLLSFYGKGIVKGFYIYARTSTLNQGTGSYNEENKRKAPYPISSIPHIMPNLLTLTDIFGEDDEVNQGTSFLQVLLL